MNDDDPVEVLNLQQEGASGPRRDGGWWIASILALICCTGLGFLVAISLPPMESDWFGMRLIAAISGGVLLGSLLSVIFGVVSFARSERRSAWCLLAAVPSGLFLLTCIGAVVQEQLARHQDREDMADRQAAAGLIRADPSIALWEHWDKSTDANRSSAFRNSFSDPRVHYTAEMLQRIYDEAPTMRDYVFANPACTAEFLSAHFQEAWDRSRKISYVMLANIASNPNTPIELVEKVAHAKDIPVGAVEPAAYALKKRARASHP